MAAKKRTSPQARGRHSPPAESRFRQATLLHGKGSLAEAQAMCEEILRDFPAHWDAMHLAGVIAARMRDFARAQALIRDAIKLQPGNPGFHVNLGNVLAELRRPVEAIASYDKAIALKPDLAEAYCNRGFAQQALGEFEAAVASFDRALALRPGFAGAQRGRGIALSSLGAALLGSGDADAAITCLSQAVQLDPRSADAHYNLGNARVARGQLEAGLEDYERALALDPRHGKAHYNRGHVLQQLERFEAALDSYDQAISIDPESADAYNNRGNVYAHLGRIAEAVEDFERAMQVGSGLTDARRAEFRANLGSALMARQQYLEAIEQFAMAVDLAPRYADAHYNLGNARVALGQLEAALEDYERALTLEPRHGKAHYNRGRVLQQLGRFEAALESYDQAISIDAGSADAYNNRGNVYAHLGRIAEAVEDFERAMQAGPGLTDARYNCALALLKGRDLARGWELYEDRWKRGTGARAVTRGVRYAADWDGQPMSGHLLVQAEQGVGDEIFYCGMLNDLRPRVGRLTVEVEVRLLELFRRSFPGIDFVARGKLDPGASPDAEVYMGSLGRHLRNRSEALDNVRVPYLVADTERLSALRARIESPGRRICGLSWISRNATIGAGKSLRLADLQPLLERSGASFVDLQYGDTHAEQEALAAATGLRLRRVEEIDNFGDLDGLAALISACDVVISVSNATAHLAAALGKTAYVLLPSAAETLWYWHVAGTRSPWYPTARLFRQARGGDWSGVVARVGEVLDGKDPPDGMSKLP